MQSKILPFVVHKTRVKPFSNAEGLMCVLHDKKTKLYFILACQPYGIYFSSKGNMELYFADGVNA